MALLLLGCLLCVVSAITGIQAFEASSRTGTVITYWKGYWRWLALVYAAIFAVAFYSIYRRFPIAWKLAWVFLIGGAADFIFEAWVGLIHQPYGWVGAIGATIGAIAAVAYWGIWWQQHREYFSPGGPPAGWSPDLSPLRRFAVAMVALALAFMLAAVAMSVFRR